MHFFFLYRQWSLEISCWPFLFLRLWKICIRLPGANKNARFFLLPPMKPWNQSLAIHFLKFLKNLYPDTRSEHKCTFLSFKRNCEFLLSIYSSIRIDKNIFGIIMLLFYKYRGQTPNGGPFAFDSVFFELLKNKFFPFKSKEIANFFSLNTHLLK